MTIPKLNFLPTHHRSRYTEPRFVQLAALCWRKGAEGPEVLLVTSSTGRWILPKGWPIQGKSPAEAALTEAWEEAGVSRGKASRKPVGSYIAIKRTGAGDDLPCVHRVYAIKVQQAVDDYPEAHRRDRIWVTPEKAARMVDEDGLREILRNLHRLL
ncbi:NUDIX hydrolase [Rubellimicrobium roseum]|uniref:NUDIX hydrolase n=1 Tax=Rubellimicrobium roseum TaxID=687525 RepID=A0A5C4NNJ0_9RHOB|nr:NUDIX hydrolase [Rubellimicrobium roseum]TNC74626.1 NUDIX hydrolase [Rubellimicrobium roseum]